MAKNTLYEHRFRTVSDAAEYLKAAQEDSEAAFLVAIRKVMEHGLIAEEEMISVPKGLLDRICGMVYATRGEQSRLDYITDEEYGTLVSLRHSGHDSIATVLSALGGK